jgi:FKBP-type peptidyl-prolyl cis-trans isomerase
MKTSYFKYLLLFIFIGSCNTNSQKSINPRKPGKNEIADINMYFVQKDRERIQNYIERKNLQMKESETGLWYFIKKEGTGNFFKDNDKVRLDYECFLLDGTKCYSSKTLGSKEVILGQSEIEAGLNEGLHLLKPGSEAIFILPPFLAFGIVGDGKSIPSRSVVVYEIEVLN